MTFPAKIGAYLYGRKQDLLGEDREGVMQSLKICDLVMTSGSACFLGSPKKVKFVGSNLSNPNMLSSRPGTLQSFLMLVDVFLGFLSCSLPIFADMRRFRAKFMHGCATFDSQLANHEKFAWRQVGIHLHLQTTCSTDGLLLNNLYHMIKIN